MQRYFIDQTKQSCIEKGIIISGDDVHHISRVMRMSPGTEIICCTKDGYAALCKIEIISTESVSCSVIEWIEDEHELPVKVIIASGLPKGDKLEWIIQKGTELGASMFIPFNAARSIVKLDPKKASKKQERWQKIAKESAEQSYRNIIPEVKEPVTFTDLLNIASSAAIKVVAYEEAAKKGEKSNLVQTFEKLKSGDSLFVLFGPEGGLSEEEIEKLTSEGFISCGLGPRILRTETAPLYVLSTVSYHFELLR